MENKYGGCQSDIGIDFTQIDPHAIRAIAGVMTRGKVTHGEDNWHKILPREHIAHAENHLNLHKTGAEGEPHLLHAATRLLLAVACVTNPNIIKIQVEMILEKLKEEEEDE